MMGYIKWFLLLAVANFFAYGSHSHTLTSIAWFLNTITLAYLAIAVAMLTVGFVSVGIEIWKDGRKTKIQKLEEHKEGDL
ncbi:hypothetical protein [Burkholderia contaminans]|uniref:hypothetical protein n=1 Tax=Burkholderia contaminans TaxID=488447 RepID=UPI0015885B16|nr:hypothetical protein [Burkholderia contaminans]